MSSLEVNLQDQNSERYVFHVQVRDADSKSNHVVTLQKRDYESLSTNGQSAVRLIERSFQFLLEREPKESILPRFDVMDISTYFPEFENEIKQQ